MKSKIKLSLIVILSIVMLIILIDSTFNGSTTVYYQDERGITRVKTYR